MRSAATIPCMPGRAAGRFRRAEGAGPRGDLRHRGMPGGPALAAMAIALVATSLLASIALAEETGAPGEPEYRLGAEDVLQIQVWGKPELGGTVVVDFSGKIQLPLIGEVEAAHRTAGEVGSLIQGRYRLLDPEVTQVLVTVVQFNSQSVTVVGEVRNPGKLGFQSIPDLWTVILAAGGATPSADLARVQVVRKEPRGEESKIATVDLSQGIDRMSASDLPVLRARDTIVLPSIGESAVQGDRFQILGAVRTPGVYRTGAAKNVIEALGASGGPLPEADLSKVILTRPSGNSAISYELNLKSYMESGRPLQTSEIKPGDIMTVPPSRGFSLLGQIGRIAPAISLVTAVVSLIVATR